MNCEDCGAELSTRAYYCGCCGKPVGFDPGAPASAPAEPGLDEVPEPAASLETPTAATVAVEAPYRSRVQGKGLCSMCMGAFPDTVLSVVDGKPYCPDCSPMVGRRRDPEVQEPSYPGSGMETAGAMGAIEPVLFSQERPSGGGAKGVMAVVVLLLLAGAGFAAFTLMGSDRIDEMMSGLDTSRGDAFLLHQKYTAGECLSYVAKGTARATGEASGGGFMSEGGAIDLTLDMSGGVDINVLKVDGEGNADLSVCTNRLDMDMDLRINDMPFPVGDQIKAPLKDIQGKVLVLKVDAFGNPIGNVANADGMQQMMSGQFGEMPRHHIKVGDTWSARMPLSEAGGAGMPNGLSFGSMAFAVMYRVEGFKSLKGRDCMVISIEGELEGADSLQMPFVEDFRFDMTLKGVAFYDVTLGRMVKMAMDIDLDLGLASPMGGGELELEFEMDIDLQ